MTSTYLEEDAEYHWMQELLRLRQTTGVLWKKTSVRTILKTW